MKAKQILVLSLLIIGMFSCNQPDSGKDMILLMQLKSDAYGFESIRFSQYYDMSGKTQTIWQEFYEAPGNLRITFDSLNSGEGMLFRNDSLYYYRSDSLAMARPQVHDLLLLAYDVYNVPAFEVFEKLEAMNYKLNYFSDSIINGREMYVAGLALDTENNSYFVIDKDSLLLRKIYRNQNGRESVILAEDYANINGRPLATKFCFYRNGKLEAEERYFNIEMDVDINPDVFDPKKTKL